jgi:hypothetical protein
MASPFAAYFAGIGTVAVALAVGFGGALMLTSPSPSQKEQKSAYEKRVEAARAESKPEKPAETVNAQPNVNVQSNTVGSVPVNPNITAATAPNVTTFSPPASPAPWPPAAVQSTTKEQPKLAPDSGVLQTPVRPAAPVEATAPVSAQQVVKSREAQSGGQVVPPEWKKKEKRDAFAQRKSQRKQIVVEQAKPEAAETETEEVETRTVTTYAPEPRPAPLGIFNLLLGGN